MSLPVGSTDSLRTKDTFHTLEAALSTATLIPVLDSKKRFSSNTNPHQSLIDTQDTHGIRKESVLKIVP